MTARRPPGATATYACATDAAPRPYIIIDDKRHADTWGKSAERTDARYNNQTNRKQEQRRNPTVYPSAGGVLTE